MSIIETVKSWLGLGTPESSPITTAAEFLAWQKSLGPHDDWTGPQRDLRRKLFDALPADDRYLVQRDGVAEYFVDANRSGDPHEHLSPSGRYRLVITSYSTGKGTWNYTRGEVFRVSDGVRVADVKRNYSSFPFSWMEDHPKGDFLIAGEDYQGQTFCQISNGESRTALPSEAFSGIGFCWSEHRLLEDGRTLLVDGCFWACPYETRFYDVSDPLGKGWPELELPEGVADLPADGEVTWDAERGEIVWSHGERVFNITGERESEIDRRCGQVTSAARVAAEGDDKAKWAAWSAAHSAFHEDYPDEDEDKDKWGKIIDHTVRLRREGDALVLVEEWKSEHLHEQERRNREWSEQARAQRQTWINESPLLTVLTEDGIDACSLTGFMYPSQVMREDGDPNPAYFRLAGRKYDPNKSHNHTATIEWGVVAGDIKVAKWVRGKGDVSKPEFPRTAEGIRRAWAEAQQHLAAEGGA